MDRLIASSPEPRAAGMGIGASIALIVLVIGGLNWALVGLFDVDVVAAVFGPLSLMSRIVYVAVGVAAVYALKLLPKLSRIA